MRRMLGLALGTVLLATAGSCGEALLEPDVLVYSRLDQAQFDTAAQGLALRFEFPTPVRRDAETEFRLMVTNTTDSLVQVAWRGKLNSYDLVVTRPDNVVVWERLYGMNISDVGKYDTLAPGESLVMSHTWDQRGNNGGRVPAGTYIVRGVFWGQAWDDPSIYEPSVLWTKPRELVIE